MKEAMVSHESNKMFCFNCPHCGVEVRRGCKKKLVRPMYRCFHTCHKCKKRIVLIGPNQDPSERNKKVPCPECGDGMYYRSQVCQSCYLKDPKKYKKNRSKGSIKNESEY